MTTPLAIFDYAATPSAVPYGSGPVTLLLAVSNSSGSFKACPQIQFTVPSSLTTNPSAITPTSLSDDWSFAPGNTDNTFVANPLAPTTGLKNGDTIGLMLAGVEVVTGVGLAEIQVDEITGAGLGEAWVKVVTVPPGLAITQFSADSLEVAPGQAVTLNWATTNASTVTLSYGGSNLSVGSSGPSTPIELTQTTTFTLTATGSGQPAVEQLTIAVEQVQVISIAADPTDVTLGGQTTISWAAVYAESFLLQPHDVEIPATETSILQPVDDPPYTVFVLTANGPGDTNSSASVGVNVDAVQINTFTTKPQQVPIGSPSSLVWDTTYATSCSITPTPEFSVSTNGQGPINPGTATTYTLTADGYQPANATTDLSFGPIITAFGFTVDPQPPYNMELNWASSGGASATYQGSGQFPIPTELSGSVAGTLQDGYVTAFRIVVTDSAGTTATVEMDFHGLMTGFWGTMTSVQVTCPTGINVAGETVTISWAGVPAGQQAIGLVEYIGSSVDDTFCQTTPTDYSTQLVQTAWSGVVGLGSPDIVAVQFWVQPPFGLSAGPGQALQSAGPSIEPLISRARARSGEQG